MTSRTWFVSLIMLGSGLLTGCNQSQEGPTSPRVTFPDSTVAVTSRAAPISGTRVAMCHRSGDATYHRLDLPPTSAEAHRAHGDATPGEVVPGAVLMVFNEACAPVATTRVITSGSWVVDELGVAHFDIGGPQLSAEGVWLFASRLGVCSQCTTGQTIAVDALFDNPAPMTDIPQATGSATVGNITYPPPLEFGGPLRFVAQAFTLPALQPGSDVVLIRTPFTMTGQLKGYLVAGRRDPMLVFDVPVSGHGTATVLFLAGTIFRSMRFDFEE